MTSVALRSGKAAARIADENIDRTVGFLNRDRMTQAIIVGRDGAYRRHFVGGGAGAECNRKTDQRNPQAEGAVTIGG